MVFVFYRVHRMFVIFANLGAFDMSVTFISDLWVHIQVALVYLYTNKHSHLFHWGHSVLWKQSSCCL